MAAKSTSTRVARNSLYFLGAIIARISGCQGQKEVSLVDQEDHGKEVAEEYLDGPIKCEVIATIGKGEDLTRPELEQIEKVYRSGKYDFVIAEDLGRLVRGIEAVRLLGIGVDHGTRTIIPHDQIDTNDPNWEERAISACAAHVAHNQQASLRIKSKALSRFKRDGGCPARPIAGYIIPEGAKTYHDWRIVVEATPIIHQALLLLEQTLNCETVADFLNHVPFLGGIGFPTGPYCRGRTKWYGKNVRRFFGNRLLGGAPGRGFKRTEKKHEAGKRRSVKNPKGPTFLDIPHLAHVDLARLDAANEALLNKNKKLGRSAPDGNDPRANVPRSVTRWPGQDGRCWYCGRISVWGGNGVSNRLMCSGARDWRCWHSISYDGDLVMRTIRQLIVDELYRLDGFAEQYRSLVERAIGTSHDVDNKLVQLHRREDALLLKEGNFKKIMAEVGPDPLVISGLKDLDSERKSHALEHALLEKQRGIAPRLPESIAELRALFEESFISASTTSRQFNALLRRLVPEFHVYCVRLCDGGHLLPRARVRIALDGILPDDDRTSELGAMLSRVITIGLFEPPQRERIHEESVRLSAQGHEQRNIAKMIAEGPSQAAVQKALALDQRMREMGLEDPYMLVEAPPADYAKLRRHRNSKYCFTPLPDYQAPQI